jgi:hypothetical protein
MPPQAHFRGAITDVRVDTTALTDSRTAGLRAHESSAPRPLSPEIVEAMLDGNEPQGIRLAKLRKKLSLIWSDQDWD